MQPASTENEAKLPCEHRCNPKGFASRFAGRTQKKASDLLTVCTVATTLEVGHVEEQDRADQRLLHLGRRAVREVQRESVLQRAALLLHAVPQLGDLRVTPVCFELLVLSPSTLGSLCSNGLYG